MLVMILTFRLTVKEADRDGEALLTITSRTFMSRVSRTKR
jgi:hypothetical protein